MTVPADPTPALQEYARPEKLVTTQWLADQLAAGRPENLVVVESDEDVLLYETGHIPGAVKIDWHLDLNDPVTRDYVDGEGFAKLMDASGITRETTVVLYGDKSNWWAAYALWVFELFGHQDVRLLDGGRAAWQAEGREMTTSDEGRPAATTGYPVVEREGRPDPRLPRGRARLPGRSADRRALPAGVLRRAHPHAGLPAGGHRARRAHPHRAVGAVGPRRRRGRPLQVPCGARGDLPAASSASSPRPPRSCTAASASARRTPGSC